jgi:hypothetical protein
MPFNLKIFIFFVALIITSGCGGTYHAYYQSLKLGFTSEVDPAISLEYVQNSATDLMQIKRGDRAKAIMALAYIEAGQHKWISRDHTMLILEQGRIVRTLGFSKNLVHLSERVSDPLKYLKNDALKATLKYKWIRYADWDNDEYGYQISSNFSDGGEQTLSIFSQNINTRLIIEDLNYRVPTNFIRTSDSWKNYFWFETTSGKLIKSVQLLSPLDEKFEMVYLSRITRLLANKEQLPVNL